MITDTPAFCKKYGEKFYVAMTKTTLEYTKLPIITLERVGSARVFYGSQTPQGL